MSVIVFEKFADFVLKKEKYKKNFVRKVIQKGGYNAVEDFYLQLRARFKKILRNGLSFDEFDEVVRKVSSKRVSNYQLLVQNIKDFFKDKCYEWVSLPKTEIIYSGLPINVNPEIGLNMDGILHIIKLYFKKTAIKFEKAEVMEKIMQDAYGDEYKDVRLVIWDIRRRHMYYKHSSENISIPYNLEKEAIDWIAYANEAEGL